MASIQYVVNAVDSASGVFAKIAASADGLDRQLADLSKRVATPEVDLKDAKFTLGMVNAAKRLDKLSAMVADPSVDVDTGKAQLEILKITAMLDRLDAKHVDVGVGVGGAAAGGGALGRFGNLTGAFAALPTPAMIGAIAAAIAALPFVAQAAAGGIVAALGGAFAGLGVLAASKSQGVQKSFHAMAASIGNDMRYNIGKPLVPVLENILGVARRVFHSMAGTFHDAMQLMAPDIKVFGDTLLRSFKQPAVKQSILDIASAFGAVLRALAPQLPGDIKDVAIGITRIANTIKDNPRAFADLISFFFKATGFALSMVAALGAVANYVEKHFIPALMDIRKGWDEARHQTMVILDGMRHEVAHVWDQIFQNTIGTVIRLGHNIETQFNSIRHGIATAFDDVRHTFATIGHGIATAFDSVRHAQGQFDAFGKDIAAVRHVILAALGDLRHGIAVVFDAIRHTIATAWDRIWHDTTGRLADLRHGIAATFDAIRHGIAAAWDAIWRNTIAAVRNGISGVVNWFRGLPGRILAALRSLGSQMLASGRNAINQFWNGLKSIGGSIISWAKNFFGGLVKSIGKFLGMSPPHPGSAFFDLGANMMTHLEAGIKSRAHKAVAAARGVAHQVANAGAGVQRWAPLVRRALAMEGLSQSLLGNVLFQMQTESGGNPNAINLTDSNAQHGDPSRGLMQTIMGTFRAYHWPGTSSNIYDPFANIAAALNYARHVYGPSLMRGGMGIGSGHGYDSGGWLPPGVSVAVNATGQPERVTSPGQETAQLAVLYRIEKLLQAAPERTGGALGNALHGAARSARYQGMYSPRGA